MINSAQAAKGYQQASATMQRSWGRKLIENVQPRLGNVILDLGCGTGELSAHLAELVGRDGKVVAVDPDTARVKLAQKTHGGISNLAIQEGSASNFPGMGSQCYDVVFSNFVLHWIQDKHEAFKNSFQSLKPGGKILLSYEDSLVSMFERFFKELIPENCNTVLSKWHFIEKAKIEEMCAAVGFDIVKSYDVKSDAFVFDNEEEMISFFWADSHGLFGRKLVRKDRLASFCARYTSGENSSPFKLFPGEGDHYCVLVAAKPV